MIKTAGTTVSFSLRRMACCCFILITTSFAAFSQNIPSTAFEQNVGQWEDDIRYQSRIGQTEVRFLEDAISCALFHPSEDSALVFNVEIGSSQTLPIAVDQKALSLNYFKGSQPERWHQNVPVYEQLFYRSAYDNIDVRYYFGNSGALRYDLLLKPGFDISQVQFKYDGIDSLSITDEGQLQIHTAYGSLTDDVPVSFQEFEDQTVSIDIRYRLINKTTLGFEIFSPFDENLLVTLDPTTLIYASYFNYTGGDDYVYSLDVDSSDRIAFCGYTRTASYPTNPGVFQSAYGGGLSDGYIGIIDPNLDSTNQLIYVAYIGGSNREEVTSLELDAMGRINVTGFTYSSDFPTTANAVDMTYSSSGDVFVARIDPTAAGAAQLLYSTYLGASGIDEAYSLELTASGEIAITGQTASSAWGHANAYQSTLGGGTDAFALILDPTLTGTNQRVYSTYFGGSGDEIAYRITHHRLGHLMIAGETESTDMPTGNPLQGTNGGAKDGFIAMINTNLSPASQLLYGTYLGGTGNEIFRGLDSDTSGAIWAAASVESTTMPTTVSAYSTSLIGNDDAYIIQLNSRVVPVNQLLYGSYFGGSNLERQYSFLVDSTGRYVYIAGDTRSTSDFPLANAYQTTHNGSSQSESFISILDMTLSGTSQVIYSTYLGGSQNDYPKGQDEIVKHGNFLYFGMTTHSSDAPVTNNAFQKTQVNPTQDTPWLVVFEDPTTPVVLSIDNIEATIEELEDESINIRWSQFNPGEYVRYELLEIQAPNSDSKKLTGSKIASPGFNQYEVQLKPLKEQTQYFQVRAIGKENQIALSEILVYQPGNVSDNRWSIYPTFVEDYLYLNCESDKCPASISIFNSLGQLVISQTLTEPKVNVKDLTPGNYSIRNSNGQGSGHLFIKQ